MKVQPPRHRKVLWIVKVIIYYLKIFGLAPFSFQTSASTVRSRKTGIGSFRFSRIGLAYNILLSITFVSLSIFIICYRFYDNLQSFNIVSHMIYVLRVLASAFSACVIMISWTLKQKSAISILNRFFEIEIGISGLSKPLYNRKMIISATLHLILTTIMSIMFWITQIIRNPSHDYVLSYWRIITNHNNYWLIAEYVIVVSLITRGLGIVNESLLELKNAANSVSCSPFVNDFLRAFNSQTQSSELATLRSLIRIRTKLSDVAGDVGGFFSFPILCCIVANFVAVVRDSHRFLISTSVSLLPLFGFITFIGINVYPIMLLTTNVTELTKQAKLTSLIVRKAITSAVNPDIKVLLEKFSLHLLHDDFTFSACGFFTLDLTLLGSIVGTTMSYLIISLQFKAPAAD